MSHPLNWKQLRLVFRFGAVKFVTVELSVFSCERVVSTKLHQIPVGLQMGHGNTLLGREATSSVITSTDLLTHFDGNDVDIGTYLVPTYYRYIIIYLYVGIGIRINNQNKGDTSHPVCHKYYWYLCSSHISGIKFISTANVSPK